MSTIVTRAGKGSPLTQAEVDQNFINLNTDKLDTSGLALGSAASPSLKFTGTNTGIYSPGADTLAFVEGGVEAMRIDGSGRLGIGSSAPGTSLEVGLPSTSATTGNIRITPSAPGQARYHLYNGGAVAEWLFGQKTSTDHKFKISKSVAGSETDVFTIDTNGNVGIGTSSPNYTLDLNSGGVTPAQISTIVNWNFPGFILRRNASNTSTAKMLSMMLQGDTDSDTTLTNHLNIWGTYSAAPTTGSTTAGLSGVMNLGAPSGIALHVNSSERARIDGSGRLLVGTSTARSTFFNSGNTALFQVEGTGETSAIRNLNDNFGSMLLLGKSRSTSNTIVQNGDTVGLLTFQGNDGTEFVECATIQCFIDGTPGANDMPGRLVFSTTADGADTPTERMRISKEGNLLFNHTNGSFPGIANTNQGLTFEAVASNGVSVFISRDAPSLYLNRNSDGGVQDFRRSGTQVGTITVTTSATAYNTSSDYRLKENVVPLTSAIDRLNDLHVRRFNFIADPDKTVDGFIAHEAQAVVPECVTGTKDEVDDDGNPVYQGIDQSKLVPLLTAALQEAVTEIKALKDRVAALENA